jgi:YidC/Oxa1 family membrane protein insertase
MNKNVFNIVFFLVIATGVTFLFIHADKHWIPKPERKAKKDPAEELAAEAQKKAEEEAKRLAEQEAKKTAGASVAGSAAVAFDPPAKPVPPPKVEPPKPTPPSEPHKLIPIGNENYYNQILLSTRGGGVQQVILPKFGASDRLGKPIKGTPLYLIPGVPMVRSKYLKEPYPIPDLKPGPVVDPLALAEPSYTVFHYAKPDDKHPDPFLGETNWKVVAEERPEGGEHKVVFETELGEPYFVKLRKTYTLGPKDYHVGLKLEVERLPGGKKGEGQLRLQLSGPRGLPVEGEWYTTTYRVALVGWTDRKGTARRQYEEAALVAARRGGEPVVKGDNQFKYMAIATQFFASGVAIDDTADDKEKGVKNPWAYVRATTELPFDKKTDPNLPYFDDVTVRAAFDTLDLAAGEKITHSYLIYNGPSKVRLLGMMEGDRAVDPQLVERYHDKLGLLTITDFRSETWLGRFANSIYWTDLVIAFTNLMHWLLSAIHTVVPNWALCIVVLTIMVRLILFVPSKKQTQMNLKMMEVQKKIAPQIEELKKKYADDPQTFNREKMRLMMAHGVNPFVAMGGCLLLLAQMPVMMGLYFCLGESVFFRLEPFLWIQNLAAPDMLVWWSERIPFISTPEDIGSFVYLGPYLNILPILAVALMIWQQNKMMPPPTDEQMASQQRMMKWMMILVAFMFYKVAAGVALYFIVGSIWGLVERRFIPKADDKKADEAAAGAEAKADEAAATQTVQTSAGPVAVPRPKGFLGRLRQAVKEKMEEMQKQADEQSKRQIRNEKGDKNGENRDQKRRDDRRDKKKKRRK